MTVDTTLEESRELIQEFVRSQVELRNAGSGAVKSEYDLMALHRRFQQLVLQLQSRGLSPDFPEYILDDAGWASYLESRAEVIRFASEQSKRTPLFGRRKRAVVSLVAGVLCAVGIGAAVDDWVAAILLGMVACNLVSRAVAKALFTYFPTPGIRTGRVAWKKRVGRIPDVFKDDVENRIDFEASYLHEAILNHKKQT